MVYFMCANYLEMLSGKALESDESNNFGCPSSSVCCEEKSNERSSRRFLFKDDICNKNAPSTCGLRNPDGLGEIFNNMQDRKLHTEYAEFPWMVAVSVEQVLDESNLYYQAAGSLIHPKVVLTAAHSFVDINPRKIHVRAGEWDMQNNHETCSHQDRKVQRVIIHESFIRSNLQNDIALLITDDEFVMTQFINTICLPPKNTNLNNQRCFASAWGKNKFGNAGNYQSILKKVEMPIVPRYECEMKFSYGLGQNLRLGRNLFCAGE